MRKISEFFNDLFIDPRGFPVVMPLTTGVKVETPDDVIGFAWTSPDRDSVRILTLPDRDWEISQDYTGLTSTLYHQNIVGKFHDHPNHQELLDGPVVGFARKILMSSLDAVLQPEPSPGVISVASAAAVACAPYRYAISKQPGEVKDLVTWLNKGVPVRMGGRKALVENLSLFVDDRYSIPKIGWILSADMAVWDEVLGRDAVEPPDEDGDPDDDLFSQDDA